jgi:O-antigen/teichoic acid export membrane protein
MHYLWSTLEKVSNILVQFLFTIYVSRFLTPDDFAIFGALTIFNSISLIIIDSGFSHVIIREKQIPKKELNSIFILNVIFGLVIFFILQLILPIIQDFFRIDKLIISGRIYFLAIPFLSLGVVPLGLLQKKLRFKVIFIISIVSSLISVSIVLFFKNSTPAYWLLIIQFVIQSGIRSVLFLYFSRISFGFYFNYNSIKRFVPFSRDILFSGLSASFFDNLHSFVIGKNYSKEIFGLYSQAKRINLVSLTLITTSFITVIYSKLSNIHDSVSLKFKFFFELEKLLFINSLFIGNLYINSNSLINLLLGDLWEGSIPYFKILSLAAVLYPIHMISINLLKVIGKSRAYFFLEIINKLLLIFSIIVAIKFDSIFLVKSYLFYYILVVLLDSVILKGVFNLDLLRQFQIISSNLIILLCSFVMFFFFRNWTLIDNPILGIFVYSIVFSCIYCLFYFIFNKKIIGGFILVLKSIKI